MNDAIQDLQATLRAASAARTPLVITGGGSKRFLGHGVPGATLSTASLTGIVDYEPRELVLTVRAGTPLAEVERVLAESAQMLPFDPPHFGAGATIGGTVATGLSGPRRAYAGSVRDFMLGVRILDGGGQDLSFGGRVIKNVAGYDITRLMAGAMGTLGVLVEMSFKVLPNPAAEATLCLEMDAAAAIERINLWAGSPLPLSATSWHAGRLHVRLSGAAAGVKAAVEKIGGERIEDGGAFWHALREQRAPFFTEAKSIFRVSVPATTHANIRGTSESQWIEWGGAQRWLRDVADIAALRSEVSALGGHVTCFRGGPANSTVFHPLAPALVPLSRRLKATFDPAGILNPGRLDSF
ncbi:MAG: glycolate oxidase subunit GlcE [Betaproteobacteria bacterium]|nr:glycolate oxidase subunit GlcE [Betaproteobacteria bacterium]